MKELFDKIKGHCGRFIDRLPVLNLASSGLAVLTQVNPFFTSSEL
jgi:hypothetical protein